MQKERTIGTTTLKTPYIGMGTWAIGGGTWWGENDDALSIRTIEEAIDRGIVWFDTAPVYGIGHSENVVGKAIKQNRSRILLSTKCGLEWDHETPCFHKVMEGRNVYRDLSAAAIMPETSCFHPGVLASGTGTTHRKSDTRHGAFSDRCAQQK